MTTDFWGNETERLTSLLVRRSLAGARQTRVLNIMEQDFPPVFIHLVKMHAEKRLKQDKPFELRPSDGFDLDDPDLKERLQAFREALLGTAVVEHSEVERIARRSVELQSAILIEPRQTLRQALFRKHETCRVVDAMIVIRGFGDGRAFVERMVALLRNCAENELFRDDFEAMARKAEAAVYKETPVSTLLAEVLYWLDFEVRCTGEHVSMLRSEILLDMLAARELGGVLTDFRAEAEEKDYWTLTEIESALERHLLVGDVERELAHSDTSRSRFNERLLELGGLRLSPRTRRRSRRRQEYEALQFNFLDEVELGDATDTGEQVTGGEAEEQLIEHFGEHFAGDEDLEAGSQPADDAFAGHEIEDASDSETKTAEQETPIKGSSEPPDGGMSSAVHLEGGEIGEKGGGDDSVEAGGAEQTDVAYLQQSGRQDHDASGQGVEETGENSGSLVLAKIFNHDESEYRSFMRHVSQMEDWLQGKSAVESLLQEKKIPGDASEAIALRDVVFRRFFTSR